MRAISDAALASLLDDDTAGGDLTTHALGIGALSGKLAFFARQPMTVCATEEAVRLFDLAGARARLRAVSGAPAESGTLVLEAEGDVAVLHRAWKTAQVLIEWASGIFTSSAAIVAAAHGVPVACTRKNVPGTKPISIKAVRAGGATMHRLGLSETLLVFAEHRLFLDEKADTIVSGLKRSEPEKKIVVEVATIEEALVWVRAGADVLQLEKFSVTDVAACLRASTGISNVLLAATGGINVTNAADYATAGADLLVTSAPYAAAPKDVQVIFERLA